MKSKNGFAPEAPRLTHENHRNAKRYAPGTPAQVKKVDHARRAKVR